MIFAFLILVVAASSFSCSTEPSPTSALSYVHYYKRANFFPLEWGNSAQIEQDIVRAFGWLNENDQAEEQTFLDWARSNLTSKFEERDLRGLLIAYKEQGVQKKASSPVEHFLLWYLHNNGIERILPKQANHLLSTNGTGWEFADPLSEALNRKAFVEKKAKLILSNQSELIEDANSLEKRFVTGAGQSIWPEFREAESIMVHLYNLLQRASQSGSDQLDERFVSVIHETLDHFESRGIIGPGGIGSFALDHVLEFIQCASYNLDYAEFNVNVASFGWSFEQSLNKSSPANQLQRAARDLKFPILTALDPALELFSYPGFVPGAYMVQIPNRFIYTFDKVYESVPAQYYLHHDFTHGQFARAFKGEGLDLRSVQIQLNKSISEVRLALEQRSKLSVKSQELFDTLVTDFVHESGISINRFQIAETIGLVELVSELFDLEDRKIGDYLNKKYKGTQTWTLEDFNVLRKELSENLALFFSQKRGVNTDLKKPFKETGPEFSRLIKEYGEGVYTNSFLESTRRVFGFKRGWIIAGLILAIGSGEVINEITCYKPMFNKTCEALD